MEQISPSKILLTKLGRLSPLYVAPISTLVSHFVSSAGTQRFKLYFIMASAWFNTPFYQCYVSDDPGSEPSQESPYPSTDYTGIWDPYDFDSLKASDINLDWSRQPLSHFDMGLLSEMDSELWESQILTDPHVSWNENFVQSNTQQFHSPATTMPFPAQIFAPLSDSPFSDPSPSITPQSSALSLQSPNMSPSSSSPTFVSPLLYNCTICQPHRPFSNPQGLK